MQLLKARCNVTNGWSFTDDDSLLFFHRGSLLVGSGAPGRRSIEQSYAKYYLDILGGLLLVLIGDDG